MFRNLAKTSLCLNFLNNKFIDFDKVKQVTDDEKATALKQESGWDRIKQLFEIDEFGNLSKELTTVMHVGLMSSLVGAIYGGVIHSRVAYQNFIKYNQATPFENHFEAKKRLQDKVTLSFGKGAWIWGWRLTLFCTTFVTITSVISKYRGKTGVLEYVLAGGVSGSLYKFQLGPRGWIVGGVLGSTLGLIGGSAVVAILKLSGMTIEDVTRMQYEWKDRRDQYVNKGLDEYLMKQDYSPVIKAYHNKIGDSGKDINVLDK